MPTLSDASVRIRSRMRWMLAPLRPERARWMVALGLGASLLFSAPALAAKRANVQPELRYLAKVAPSRQETVIVQFRRGVSQAQASRLIRARHGHRLSVLPVINGAAATMSAADALALGEQPSVKAVSINARVRSAGFIPELGGDYPLANLVSTYPSAVSAPQAWFQGATGAGVGVAVIDSGIDGNLGDFASVTFHAGGHSWPGTVTGSRVVESAVVNPGASDATDPYGHGTFVAGVLAGNGDTLNPSDPNYGNYIGVAPNANLISVKVGDDQGNATELDVINGIEFAIQHKSDYNIRAINLSLQSDTPQSYLTDPLDAAAESAWMNGIVVVAAAGNQGNTPGAETYAPANDPYVITVGATDTSGTTPVPASYSSVGMTQDGFSKPDVYAPGSHIVSVLAPNSAFAAMCPSCAIGGEYIKASGTSFAAPVVTGAVADLLSLNPNLTPDQVKAILIATSQPLPNSAAGSINIEAALSNQNAASSPADQGLTPSTLLDGNGNLIGWNSTSFVPATGSLAASWARSSWSCASCTSSTDSEVDPTRSSWSRSSWSVGTLGN